MEKRLEQYRLRKRRKENITEIKDFLTRFLMLGSSENQESPKKPESHAVEIEEESKLEEENTIEHSDNGSISDGQNIIQTTDDEENDQASKISISTDQDKESTCFRYTLWTVYALFWCTLYIIAIELQFGIVFLMFSALLGIYFNTRTGGKRKNEISAYSVFNKNCESIDGTLKAEQFEREIRFGPGYVR